MAEQKEKALLEWIKRLPGCEYLGSLKAIDYGDCFTKILQYLGCSENLEEPPSTKQCVNATEHFLKEHYNTCFSDKKLVDFSQLECGTSPEDVVQEVAKVLLLLLCAGIQDNNEVIQTAALQVDATLHWDMRQLIEAVVRPDSSSTSLPTDFASIFSEHSGEGSTSSYNAGDRAEGGAACSWSGEVPESPVRQRLASLNFSQLNDSLQAAWSPVRVGGSTFSPATPLEELVNSPQLAKKINRREKEQRYRMENQLKQKDREIKEIKNQLQTQINLREEFEIDLQDANARLEKKDCRISQLEQQAAEMRALKDRLDEMRALEDSNQGLERELEGLRAVAQNLDMMKQQCQSLYEENKGLCKEITSLREEVSSRQAQKTEAERAQVQKLNVRVMELEAALDAAHEARDQMNEEKGVLLADLEVLREVNQHQRQQLAERRASVDEGAKGGENMGVVTDQLLEEMNATWTPPEVMADMQQELNTAKSALKKTQEECQVVKQKADSLVMETAQLKMLLDSKMEECQQLRNSLQRCQEDCTALDVSKALCLEQQTTLKEEVKDLLAQLETAKEGHRQSRLTLTAQVEEHKVCLKTSKEELEETRKSLGQENERLQAAFDSVSAKRDDLRSELNSRQQEIERMTVTLTATAAQCQQLTSDLEARKCECERLLSARLDVERELASTKQGLEEAVAIHQDLSASLKKKEMEVQALGEQVEERQSEVTAARLQLQESGMDNQQLKKQLEEKEAECLRMTDNSSCLQQQLQAEQKRQECLEGKVVKLQALNEKQQELLAAKQAEFDRQLALNSTVEVDLSETQAAVEHYKALARQREADLQTEKKHRESMKAEHDATIHQLQAEVVASTERVREEAEKQASSQQQVLHLEAILLTKEKALQSVQRETTDKEQQLKMAAEKEVELEGTVNTLRQRISELEQKERDLLHSVECEQQQRANLKGKLEDLQSAMDQKEVALRDQEVRHEAQLQSSRLREQELARAMGEVLSAEQLDAVYLRQQLSKAFADRDGLEVEIVNLYTQLHTAHNQIQRYSDIAEDCQNNRSDCMQQKDIVLKLQKKFKEDERKMADLVEKMNTCENRLKESEFLLNTERAKRDKLVLELEEHETDRSKLIEALFNAEKEIKQVLSEKDMVLSEKDKEMRQVLLEKDEEMRGVLSEKDKKMRQVLSEKDKEMRQVLSEKDKEMRQVLSEKDKMRGVLSEKDSEMRRVLSEKDNEMRQVLSEKDKMRGVLSEKDSKMRQVLSEKDEEMRRVLSEKDEEMRRVLSEKDEEMRQVLQEKDKEVQRVLSEREEEVLQKVDKLEKEREVLSSQNTEHGTKIQQLEEQLGLSKQEKEHLQQELSKLQLGKEAVDKLREKLEQQEKLLQQREEENHDLQAKVRASETSESLAEQLKGCERKLKESEAKRKSMEDRVRQSEKEIQWRIDAEKLQEMTDPCEELQATPRGDTTTMPSGEKSASPNDSLELTLNNLLHFDLRPHRHLHLDGSFTNSLPQTPGNVDRQLTTFDPNMSAHSLRKTRHRKYSVASGKSNALPSGTGQIFPPDEEPENPELEWGRLGELQRRNTLCLPHMKTSYPVETQTVEDDRFTDDAMQQARYSDMFGRKSSAVSSKGDASSRKRRAEGRDTDHAFAQSECQNRKWMKPGPLYHKPGPPTPTNSRKHQGGELSTPRCNPPHSCMPAPFHRSPPKVPTQNPRRQSIAFDLGFSPVKNSGLRRLPRQTAFISKSKLPEPPRTGDSALMPAPTGSSNAKAKSTGGRPPRGFESKGSRKPLGVRNIPPSGH
ncbi:uncharacterized protein LOC143283946 isoform X2 [Babylonia areolata]|uniref:uncharacterized protein LOC143283946 isoform X2 n=1 Tax=Babylonia areolata TaxID=304850 RepID=UPI003FD2FDA1